jgi:23S rRNA U2552 (ribose-2'-O)-methylase RlmE/FtsJ
MEKNLNQQLTEKQKNILIGLILGDVCMVTKTGKSFSIKFAQGTMHKAYLFHLYDIFKNFVRTKPKKHKTQNS